MRDVMDWIGGKEFLDGCINHSGGYERIARRSEPLIQGQC